VSDALDYLMKVRPEAMQSYFGFIRAAGKHLDQRTRAIISVITKADRQTDAGFRQYVTRALREGVSADEILDALLVAFPTLGLSKIVWAVDVLLDMNLPEFAPGQLDSEAPAGWHDVAAEADIAGRRLSRVAAAGRELFVFNSDGVRVYDSRCPHQATNIPAEAARDDVLTCPRHGWQFDLATGRCIARGDRPLHLLEHRLEAGRLLVRW
jgi:nitrite reductase/ring-hydroxylating ferredoxin subunit/alkylhydroperoxidase/carboxymuconolactone decarboxylase family protein YurZ